MFDNIEAVIFDLDGTVIDSMWMWEAIDVEYFARYNVPFTHDYQLAIEGMSFHETAVFFKENTAGRVCGYGFPLYGSEAFHAPCPYDRAAYGRGISGRKTG